MGDKPILFSAPMVRALIEGRKTQTRRPCKWVPTLPRDGPPISNENIQAGDRLWVREAWRCNAWATDLATIFYRASEGDGYTTMCEQYPVADHKPMRVTRHWRPSIHMPRWTSRLTLVVTDVRVERLHDLSEADAVAEGMTQETADALMDADELAMYAATEILCPHARGRILFEAAWERINGPGSWEANPWVAAYTFDVHHCNIDQMESAHA